MNEILELTKKLCALVEKEAKKESNYAHGEAKVFTEFLQEIQFFMPEIEDLIKQEPQLTD